MSTEPNKIKTTEDMLTNYTSVEVESGVYVNSGLLNLFKNLKKDLSYIGLDDKSPHAAAIYEYNMTDKLRAHLYMNSKQDYLELVHFYDVPDYFDEHYLNILNIVNREMTHSKAMSNIENLKSVEVSASYFGEFSIKTFLNFLNSFHQDILNFHKVNSMYIESVVMHLDKKAKEIELREAVNKVADKKSLNISGIKKMVQIPTKKVIDKKLDKKIVEVKSKKSIKPDIVKKTKNK